MAAKGTTFALALGLALALALGGVPPASAQDADGAAPGGPEDVLDGRPIGVVDMAAVLQRSDAIAQIREAIDRQNTLFEEDISKEEVAIKEAETELNEDKDLITEDEFNTRLAEFEKRVVGLQQQIQAQRSSFDSAYADAQRRLEEELLRIISDLATERGFALVIQKKDAVIYDSSLDITDEALARLDERTKNLKITLERKDNQ